MEIFGPEESSSWLREQMLARDIETFDELQDKTGIHKGNLSRYFRQQQSPSVRVIPALCDALGCSPHSLLIGLGVIAPSDEDALAFQLDD